MAFINGEMPEMPKMDNLDISVIIPTFHFEDSVRKVILALNEQSVRVNEVIIVDSSKN